MGARSTLESQNTKDSGIRSKEGMSRGWQFGRRGGSLCGKTQGKAPGPFARQSGTPDGNFLRPIDEGRDPSAGFDAALAAKLGWSVRRISGLSRFGQVHETLISAGI